MDSSNLVRKSRSSTAEDAWRLEKGMEDNVSGDDDTVRREMEAPIASVVT